MVNQPGSSTTGLAPERALLVLQFLANVQDLRDDEYRSLARLLTEPARTRGRVHVFRRKLSARSRAQARMDGIPHSERSRSDTGSSTIHPALSVLAVPAQTQYTASAELSSPSSARLTVGLARLRVLAQEQGHSWLDERAVDLARSFTAHGWPTAEGTMRRLLQDLGRAGLLVRQRRGRMSARTWLDTVGDYAEPSRIACGPVRASASQRSRARSAPQGLAGPEPEQAVVAMCLKWPPDVEASALLRLLGSTVTDDVSLDLRDLLAACQLRGLNIARCLTTSWLKTGHVLAYLPELVLDIIQGRVRQPGAILWSRLSGVWPLRPLTDGEWQVICHAIAHQQEINQQQACGDGANSSALHDNLPPALLQPVSALGGQSPWEVWQKSLGELQLQMTRSAYDAWVKEARLVSHYADTFCIAVSDEDRRAWLSGKLRPLIERVLRDMTGTPARMTFTVATGP